MKKELQKLRWLDNATLQQCAEIGFVAAADNNVDGFEHIVGNVLGGQLKVVFTPAQAVFDSVKLDCESNDFADAGLTAVFEKEGN